MPETEKKTFTFEEAVKLLPEVKERTRRAMEKIGELEASVDDEDEPDEAKENLALEDSVFVGDSRYDEGAALAAPVSFVGYRYGRGARIESLAELLDGNMARAMR